ncbi:peptidylprolyl isomerase [Pseudoduganella sp. RAF53_2]|uniref:peptidylprolyl isomerase n=1 Tax=unclassified Pseudoduganella TaxID=2637179 RepID=UPI003F9C290E
MRTFAALSALLALASAPARADVSARPSDPVVAARVNGEPLYAFTAETMLRVARQREPAATRTALIESLVLDRLLAPEAREIAHPVPSAQAVGFAPDVATEDRLAALLAERHPPALDIDAVRDVTVSDGALDDMLGKPGQLRLVLALAPAQLERARSIPVARYTLPGDAERELTLFDVYHRQNVQGRVALFNRQPGFLQQQARQAVEVLHVVNWAVRQFGALAVNDLRRALDDQEIVIAFQRLHGMGSDTDSGSAVLDALAAQVSAEQIQFYYASHKEEFARIESVRARHMRLEDEDNARGVFAALQSGADFAALARKYSHADDAKQGGDLGWIRQDTKRSWLANLAFAQEPGKASPPVRAPVGPDDKAYWEIVLVEAREMGYHAADSETVLHIARRAVARQVAIAMFADMRACALRAASVELNASMLDQPPSGIEARCTSAAQAAGATTDAATASTSAAVMAAGIATATAGAAAGTTAGAADATVAPEAVQRPASASGVAVPTIVRTAR